MTVLILALALGSYVTDNDVFPASECVGPGGATFVGDACFNDSVSVEFGSACDGSVDSDAQWDGDSLNIRGATEFTDTVCVAADSTNLSIGSACSTDATLAFDGTDLAINSSGDVVFNASPRVGILRLPADVGAAGCVIDFDVSATPADGTEESYQVCVDSVPLFTVYTESTGAGSVDTLGVKFVEPAILDTQIAASGHAEPFACSATTEGALQYVDDSDDTAYPSICVCANLDGTGYDWRSIGDIAGTACPFY